MKNIEFLRKKDYKFIKEIGQGGTGKTILIKDEFIDEVFVCKKYSPYYEDDKILYFKYFIDEIKLLHNIYHKNIVRVFNYFLYPQQTTGYILMEYIKGFPIDEFLEKNPDKIEEIFIQAIDGFKYLEDINVLHRDIRPANILISENNTLKIIDFGFGKLHNLNEESEKSITLNWRYIVPNEFQKNIYNNKTEVYFLGKMFEEIISNNNNVSFKYRSIISKMIKTDPKGRIESFFNVSREIIKFITEDFEFNYSEKIIYKRFAENLIQIISQLPYNVKYNSNIDDIINKLDNLCNNSILEDYLQNNNKLINIFIEGQYTYYKNQEFSLSNLQSFLSLIKSQTNDKQKIVLNNLWERFDSIERVYHEDDDLPF